MFLMVAFHQDLWRIIQVLVRSSHQDFDCASALVDEASDVKLANSNEAIIRVQCQLNFIRNPFAFLARFSLLLYLLVEALLDIALACLLIDRLVTRWETFAVASELYSYSLIRVVFTSIDARLLDD